MLIPCIGISLLGGIDPKVYYGAIQFVAAGRPEAVYLESATIGNLFYGPIFLVFAKAFSWISYPLLVHFFQGLQICSYIVLWFSLKQLYPNLFQKQARWLWLIVWLVSIKPTHASFQVLNFQLAFMASFALAEVFSRSGKKGQEVAAGFLVTLMAAMKLFPGFILVFYFLSKSRKVSLGILLGGVFSILAPFLVFGPSMGVQLHQAFFSHLTEFHSLYSLKTTYTLSLASALTTWLSPVVGDALTSVLIKVISVTLAVGFFGLVYINQKRSAGDLISVHFWALSLALMALLNSGSRVDYFIFYLPAFCSLVEIWFTEQVGALYKSGVLVATVLFALLTEWTLQNRELNHRLEDLRVVVVGMVIVCALLALNLIRIRPNSRSSQL